MSNNPVNENNELSKSDEGAESKKDLNSSTPFQKVKQKQPIDFTGLTDKQKLFVQFYLKTNNAAQSAISAGYKTQYPNKVGHALLKLERIHKILHNDRQVSEEVHKLSPDWLVSKLTNIVIHGNDSDKIRAIAEISKVMGYYAPDKHVNYNVSDNVKTVDTLYQKYLAESENECRQAVQ